MAGRLAVAHAPVEWFGEASQPEQAFHLVFVLVFVLPLKFRCLAPPCQVSTLPQPSAALVPSSLKVPEWRSVPERCSAPHLAPSLTVVGKAQHRCTRQVGGYQRATTACSVASQWDQINGQFCPLTCFFRF